MKKFKTIILVAVFSITCNVLFATSPLIKASFYEAYQSDEIVQYAEMLVMIDGDVSFYLMDETVSLGNKAAVINALQWNEKSKTNVDTYKMFLGRKYGVGYKDLDLNKLSGDELLCLGYMMLLDENVNLDDSKGILELAIEKNTTSYISNLIYALASAQIHLNDSQECEAYTVCNSIRTNAAFTKDINDQAIGMIFQEVDAYKSACN